MTSHPAKSKLIQIHVNGAEIPLKIVTNIDELLTGVESEDDIPFWAELWPGALALAEELDRRDDLTNKAILELGAGIGLPGIIAAKKGALVVQSDYKAEALELAKENARINNVDIKFSKEDWREFKLKEKFDFIIGSDILYEPKLHPNLINIFENNLKPEGLVILSDPGRANARSLIGGLSRQGWNISKDFREVSMRNNNTKIDLYYLKI